MKKLFIGLLFIYIVVLISMASPTSFFAAEKEGMTEKSSFTLEVKGKLITLHAEKVSFKMILQDLEKKSGIKVNIYEGVDDKQVSLDIKALPTYAVSSLLEKMKIENFAVVYDKELGLEVIYILPQGQNIAEIIKGKTIIKPAQFENVEKINRIKGKEILTVTKGTNNIPIRYVKDEVVLKFHRGVTKKEIETILNKYNLNIIDDEGLSKIGYIKVRIPDGREVFNVTREIAKEYKIKRTEPNYISNILAVTDPLYHNQWYVSDIKFDKAWAKVKSEDRIKVAVIDTGADKEHPDLQGKILNGYDFVNNISEVTDKHGHGTFVAGIISANSNDIGIKGLYDFADIIPVKAMGDNGIGTYEDVAKGIIYAVDNGAKVINLSIGGYGYSSMLQDAVDYALENGCILVAAGGNDGIKQEIYPAAYPDVIGVSAIGQDEKRLSLSNSGKHIDVAAPGENIISTGLNGQYTYATGTSASTPMVSALAAILLVERTDLSSSAIQRLIMQSAKDLGEKGRDKIYGSGKIDADSALEQKVIPFHDVAVRSVSVEPLKFEKGKPTFITATISNSGTYTEEKCDVVFYEIFGELRKEIGRKNAVIVIDKLKVNFEWKPENPEKEIRFQVYVVSENDSSSSNNSKFTNNFSIKVSENLYVLHSTDPPVHQWVVYQAKSVWPNTEINFYLPSSWSNNVSTLNSKEITNGAYLEDEDISSGACYPHSSCSPCLGWPDSFDLINYHPYCHHFWNPDGGKDAGLYWVIQWDSAYRRAQTLWDDKVISNYNSGNKIEAYRWLGRVAHLLTDMSVPAHVLLDVHIGDPVSGDDNYEDYMKEFNDEVSNDYNYKQWAASGSAISASSLYNLFYHMAEIADDFDSDDYDGEVDQGTRDRDLIGDITYEECKNIGNTLMPEAMRHVAGLYKLFWNETHGSASVSGGVTVTPSPVILGQNFTVSFTLKEVTGAPITYENIAVAILRSDNSLLFNLVSRQLSSVG